MIEKRCPFWFLREASLGNWAEVRRGKGEKGRVEVSLKKGKKKEEGRDRPYHINNDNTHTHTHVRARVLQMHHFPFRCVSRSLPLWQAMGMWMSVIRTSYNSPLCICRNFWFLSSFFVVCLLFSSLLSTIKAGSRRRGGGGQVK